MYIINVLSMNLGQYQVRLNVLGKTELLPPDVLEVVHRAGEATTAKHNEFWLDSGAGVPGVGGAIVKFYDNNGNDIGSAKGFSIGFIGGMGFKGDFQFLRT
ncbi:hypothetical protein FRC06_008839 [Ceratobasidium sp. 370]|nr:hypothetical protein FRC06_008839 [Ceratobasidium sp. 370]